MKVQGASRLVAVAALVVYVLINSTFSYNVLSDMNKRVTIVPIGKADRPRLEKLSRVLEEKLAVKCSVGAPMDIPQETYDPKRRQYYSTLILQKLESLNPGGEFYVLGVTELDLYVPTLNFVFGEAMPNKRVAIISLCRLQQEFYGEKKDEALLEERMIKEAVHELGHVWGMRHCENSSCVMFFSNSLTDTDRKSDTFCKRCKRRLQGGH